MRSTDGSRNACSAAEPIHLKVYAWCISRTNIDIDDTLIAGVMRQYGLRTKKDAVNFALRKLYVEPMTIEQALAMRGTGWDGDLDAMRDSEAAVMAEVIAALSDLPNDRRQTPP
jgi:Arc/MetJ family transcription regulator